ncbi:MAG: AI-2E family transporter [Acidobacteria bacterium]|jgi:predicted PurR-regulated permease PerM|nr:AI-2E family transporter [Acidobacteriota bacterium]
MTDQTKDINTIKIFLGFITIVIAAFIMKILSTLFLPLGMALLLYFLFHGVIKKLVEWKIPKFLALSFLIIFIFIIFYAFGILIFSSVTSVIQNFPAYYDKLIAMAQSLSKQLNIPIADVEKYIADIDWTQSINKATTVLAKTFGSFASFVGNLLLVLIYLLFMLAGAESLTGRIEKAFNEEKSTKIKGIIKDIEIRVRQYLSVKTFISILDGIFAGIILFIGGVDFVIFISLSVVILNYIPNIGSTIAVILPALVAFLQFGFSLRLFLVIGGLMVAQFLVGNYVEPRIAGRSLNLSPVMILISLIFWGYIWGIVGMILSVPLLSTIKIACENIPSLKPLAELISGK